MNEKLNDDLSRL